MYCSFIFNPQSTGGRDILISMASAESASSPKLLLEALAYWVEKQPDKVLFNYLKDDGTPLASMTYAAVELKSRALAAHLVAPAGGSGGGLGCAKGDRVLLVFEPSLTYIVAFIACVRAGLVAVPVFPPDPRKLKKDMFMFATIAGDCGAKIALTSTTYDSATKMAALKHLFSNDAKWPVLTWCAVDTLPAIVQVMHTSLMRGERRWQVQGWIGSVQSLSSAHFLFPVLKFCVAPIAKHQSSKLGVLIL